MSDDWVNHYIVTQYQKQQEKQNTQKRADLAERGAPNAFQQIRERIQQDIDTLHKAGIFSSVILKESSFREEFEVTATSSPFAALRVKLSTVLIEYTYTSSPKGKLNKGPGALRVSSDVEGVTQVHDNGKTFADESEVSEFLLRPLLDYVDS
jgi:hypothetical protein